MPNRIVFLSCLPIVALMTVACSSPQPQATAAPESTTATAKPAPPPRIQAWLDRLTVQHEYDPKTGFIVARESVPLPPLIAEAPPLDAAIAQAGPERIVIAFVTADRCAPCQQYKRDALNDAAVIATLANARFLPTHLEVDRAPELADAHLGTRAIPMTYALREGKIVAELRGQRSAADLLEWIERLR
jgi:hypothetical protein